MGLVNSFLLHLVIQIGLTALSLAAYHGRADMVKMLLSCGASTDQQDDVNRHYNNIILHDAMGHHIIIIGGHLTAS